MSHIISYAHIKYNQVAINGTIVFTEDKMAPFSEFLANAYKTLGISYPKFHKMDSQCKLGFLCAEFALKNTDFISSHSLNNIAIVLSNTASSLETDRQHQQSIADPLNYFPSPAVFVYTLPNIVIGELAIRHKITGENAFFVSETLDADLLVNYTKSLLNEATKAAICGWVEVDGNNQEAFFFLVENTQKPLVSEENQTDLISLSKNELSDPEKQKNRNKNTIFNPLKQSTIIELYNQTIWTH